MQPQAFIDLLAPAAQEAARRYPGIWASVAIAQSALETGWGGSGLAVEALNYFGVKWQGNTIGPFPEHVRGITLRSTTERPTGRPPFTIDAWFRVYATVTDSALDYAANLRAKDVYAKTGCWEAKTADAFIQAIGSVYTGGDTKYAGKVLDIMDRYQLRQYDTPTPTPKETAVANFPTPDQILKAFRDEGLNVYEMPGWRGRCRCCSGAHNPHASSYIRSWREFNGVTWHMTYGSRLSGQAAVDYTNRILIGGNGSTPGPLCLAGVDADGRILMVSSGRANHIGSISQRSLDAMRAASFSTTGNHNLRGTGVDGNAHTLGFEGLGSGSPNAAQWEAMVKASVALCRLKGWSGQEVHGHGEASDQRSFTDPGCDMGAVRREVMARLRKPSSPSPAPAPAPEPAVNNSTPTPGASMTHHYNECHVNADGINFARAMPEIFSPQGGSVDYDTTCYIDGSAGTTITARLVEYRHPSGFHRHPEVTFHARPGQPTVGQLVHNGRTYQGGVQVWVDIKTDLPDPVMVRAYTHTSPAN